MNKDFRKAIKLMEKAIKLMQESRAEATKATISALQCDEYLRGCYKLHVVYRQWRLILLV